MKNLFTLIIILFLEVSLFAQTSCQTTSGGNGLAEFTNVGQTFTMSGCTGDYLHSIELQQVGNYAPHQIILVEIFTGNSINPGNLLYSSNTVIELPDTHGELYTVSFNDGTCNGGGSDCLQFTSGVQLTLNFTFGNVAAFSGAGISANNSNPYAGGAIWANNSNASLQNFDLQFDLMTTSSNPLALPVELTGFQAKRNNEKEVNLTWQTASELNNMGFDIERSSDGADWETINFVEGIGTTSASQTYSFMDSRPLVGYNYYRLKQIDFDEKYEYSAVRSVLIDDQKQADLQVFPNPNNGQFTLSLFKPQYSDASIRVYGTEGNLVWEEYVGASEELTYWKKELDLPKGKMYHVVTYVDGEVLTQKIMSMNKR